MDKTFDDLRVMLKANYPILYFATSEYDRTKQKARRIAFELGYNFNSWDIVEGLSNHIRNQNNRLDKVEKHKLHGSTKNADALLGEIKALAELELKEETESNKAPVKEVYFIEDFHKYFRDEKVLVYLRKLTTLLKGTNKHIILVSPFLKLPDELEKYVTIINVPLPDRDDLQVRLKDVKENEDINPDLEKYLIDSALGMTDMEADLAFRLAKVKVGLNSKEATRIISNEKQQIIKKSGILDYFEVNEELEKSVGGLGSLKSYLKDRSKLFERKAKEKGLKEPKGILLLGVPGCGKSLTAKCVANEWKQPLLRLDIGKVFQAEVGSSENNIRLALATAEAVAPCVLWIDELEKGLNVGGGEKDGGTNSRVFSTILTWMQEKTKPVFVVATANNISDLPPELLRKGRFDEIFFVDLPTKEERKNIFQIHLNKHGQKNITDFDSIAELSKYFNGAEIEEAVNEARFLSYIENADNPQISIRHLEQTIKQIVPLAQTMKRKIDGLREWATTRARPASAEKNNEKLEVDEKQTDAKVNQTKREKQEDIF